MDLLSRSLPLSQLSITATNSFSRNSGDYRFESTSAESSGKAVCVWVLTHWLVSAVVCWTVAMASGIVTCEYDHWNVTDHPIVFMVPLMGVYSKRYCRVCGCIT